MQDGVKENNESCYFGRRGWYPHIRRVASKAEADDRDRGQTYPHEAGLLMLDCSKAYQKLGWKPKWDFQTSAAKTIEWYQAFYERDEILTHHHLRGYCEEI